METKDKHYKPGQIITLNIEGVNHRYRIKRLRDPYDEEDPSPACGMCEFAHILSWVHPCGTLCFQGHCFKTIEHGRVIPDNCYLLEIE